MSKKKERPSWFKMFLHQKALIDAVPDEDAGKALKGSLQYFETGDLPALDGLGENMPPPITEERFLELCGRFLSKPALQELRKLSQERINPTLFICPHREAFLISVKRKSLQRMNTLLSSADIMRVLMKEL